MVKKFHSYDLFGSLEREESREGVEGNGYSLLCLNILKLVRVKGIISHTSCLDVLKIMIKMRINDLNRQIYPHLHNVQYT